MHSTDREQSAVSQAHIRPLALCVFSHPGKVLVNFFEDAVTDQTLYRPLGGGIEFGEKDPVGTTYSLPQAGAVCVGSR
ncbi:hypothetical protein J3B00_004006 [Pseudomonas sp. BP8]|nr:hypothetical protein [Pseudomonas sp. BP8]